MLFIVNKAIFIVALLQNRVYEPRLHIACLESGNIEPLLCLTPTPYTAMSDDNASQETETQLTPETSSKEDGHSVTASESLEPPKWDDEEEEDTGATEIEGKERRLSEKKERQSQEEWQKMKEKSKEVDELKATLGKLSEALGNKNEDGDDESDPIKELEEKILSLQKETQVSKEEVKRAKFEAKHPVVETDEYAEEWNKACKAKLDPDSKYYKLDYDEIWKLTKKDSTPSETHKQYEEQQRNEGVVPSFSKSTHSSEDGISADEMKFYRNKYPRLSKKQILELVK